MVEYPWQKDTQVLTLFDCMQRIQALEDRIKEIERIQQSLIAHAWPQSYGR